MTEREAVDGTLCARSDLPHRYSHKLHTRSKDKHGSSGSYGKRGQLQTPPTSTTPTRHPPHHHSPHGYHGRQTSRERRKGVRGRVDNHGNLATLPAAQCASVSGEGRKKTSLNHLLNFTLSPREALTGPTSGDRRGRRRYKTHSYNKEHFLQANCQFVVSESGDYTIHTSDPDLLVEWDSIELVRLFCHDIPSCPICLYPPRAAKITRCGHVYCSSCVLHYLSLGERKWRKCPICYESIYKKDLKSVMAMSTTQYSVGDVISMKLMAREKNSTLVLPISQRTKSPSGLPTLSAAGERFVKLVTCTPAESLEGIVGPEREALVSQLEALAPEEESEKCFVELALEELKVREMSLRQTRTVSNGGVETSSGDHTSPQPLLATGCGLEVTDSEESGEGAVQPDSGGSLDISMEQLPSSAPSTPPDTSLVYFYQAADGQHLYLHTINARCLVKEYGGLESAPEEIKAHIVEMEQLSMTEEARSRYKYLSHLPVTCEFALCELDLRPPLVSRDTLAHFQDDLDRRRHKRMRKRREERRREKTTPTTQKPVLSNDAFPLPTSLHQPLSPERIHDLLPQLTSPPTPPHTISPLHTSHHLNPVAREFVPGLPQLGNEAGPFDDVESSDDTSPAHPSFAEALRGRPLPVWPRTPSRTTSGSVRGAGVGREEEEEEVTVPSFKEAFTEALLTTQVSTQQGQSSKKTAKKGRKKLVLFSTGGARGTHN